MARKRRHKKHGTAKAAIARTLKSLSKRVRKLK